MKSPSQSQRFWRIAGAGISFEGGAATVNSSTIIAALVFELTASTVAVGAAAGILRYGWLFPQLFVAYFAQRAKRRMPFYVVGAFGRATCLAAIAVLLALASGMPHGLVVTGFFGLWTAYAFVSGIVAVPYNDIVARSVVSSRRSRLFATRFFGGGLLGLGVAAAAHQFINAMSFPSGYAALALLGAALLYASSLSFVSAGEPQAPPSAPTSSGFIEFLKEGFRIFGRDRRFRMFVYVQWLGGAVMMAWPFYILQASALGGSASDVGVLLAAQTAGALLSNALWGWWGDRFGKASLLQGIALLRGLPPLLTLIWTAAIVPEAVPGLLGFIVVFFFLGALVNGGTIAMLGYLMEISPDDRRPAYSGYFNALVAPAALLPLAAAAVAELLTLSAVFAVALSAAVIQFLVVRHMRRTSRIEEHS